MYRTDLSGCQVFIVAKVNVMQGLEGMRSIREPQMARKSQKTIPKTLITGTKGKARQRNNALQQTSTNNSTG